MNNLCYELSLRLLNKRLIKESQIKSIKYGLEVVLMQIINFTTILFICISTNKYLETMIFFLTLIPLRSIKSGYHCKNYISCLILTTTIYMLAIYFPEIISMNRIYIYLFTTISILIAIYLSLKHKEKKCYLVNLLLVLIYSFAIYLFPLNKYFSIISLMLLIDSISSVKT